MMKVATRSWIYPSHHPAMFVTASIQVGDAVMVHGTNGWGHKAAMRLQAKDLTPPWATRLATWLRLASGNFTQVIQGVVEDAGLPVDYEQNWDAVLHNNLRRLNVWPTEPLRREELIQEALTTLFYQRKILQRFDPNNQENPTETLAKRVTIYIATWLRYYFTSKGGTLSKAIAETEELRGGNSEMEEVVEDTASTNEPLAQAEDAQNQDLAKTLRSALKQVLNYHANTNKAVMQLYDIIIASQDAEDILEEWKALGYTYQNPKISYITQLLRESLGKALKRIPHPESLPNLLQKFRELKAPKPVEASLGDCIRQAHKQASSGLSQVYFTLGSAKDPRVLKIEATRHEAETVTYELAVGDFETDKALDGVAIKSQLTKITIPTSPDPTDNDPLLLTRILASVVGLLYANAVEFFYIPLAEKPTWANTIRVDIAKLVDFQVRITELHSGSAPVLARSLGSEQNLTPAQQVDIVSSNDKNASLNKNADRQALDARRTGQTAFNPDYHADGDDPSPTWLGGVLKRHSIKDTANNLDEAIQGFKSAMHNFYHGDTHA